MSNAPRAATPHSVAPPTDHAFWWILGSNLMALLGALRDEGGLLMLLWIYWIQSIVIGYYARRRILALRRFSTEGFKINDQAVDPTPATQRRTANFFALHYGFFHVGYLVFLLSFGATGEGPFGSLGQIGRIDQAFIILLAFGFWQSHRASHREHVETDLARVPNIGTLMFLPYARIVPMHLTIILGAVIGRGGGLVLFGALKTAADLLMHKVEHRWLRRARAGAARGVTESPPTR